MKIKLLFMPLAIVLSIVIVVWVVKPNWDSLKFNEKELEKLTDDFKIIENQEASIIKARNSYDSLGQDLTLIDNAIPEIKNPDDLLAEVTNKMSASNLFLSEVGITEGKKVNLKKQSNNDPMEDLLSNKVSGEEATAEYSGESYLKYTDLNLKLIGEYSDLKNFISSIYSMNRYLKIYSLVVGKVVSQEEEAGGEDRGRLSIEIVLSAYFEEGETEDQVSQLISSKNYIMKNLLTGQVSEDIIGEFKKYRTKQIYEFPFNSGGVGKDNPFTVN